jgi:AcrR family transcriptional regulator
VRLQDIAAEAGVSKALLHYYAESREQLLADTFEFGDERARQRVKQDISGGGTGAERLRKLLHLYFADETEVREDWMLWSEFSASAVFDPELSSKMHRAFADWSSWLEQIVREGVQDGSIVSDRPPGETVSDLTALVDGLGLQLVRGLMSADQARQTLDRVMAKLGLMSASSDDGADDVVAADETSELIAIEGLLRATLRRLEKIRTSDRQAPRPRGGGAGARSRTAGGRNGARAIK